MFKSKKLFCISALFCITVFSPVLNAETNEVYKIKLGDISVTAIMDTTFDMNNGLIKNGNTEVIKKYLPDGKLTVPVNTYIIKTQKQTILVDAGAGARLIANMKTAGFSPDSIGLVLITHGHFDHVAGLVKDGKPLFTKAKVMFSEKEKALYEDKAIEALPADLKPYFMMGNQVCKIYGVNIQTFAYGAQVADGIVSIDLNGHTAGQSGYMVESKGQKLLIAGDFLHMAPVQLAHPEYSLVYDADINQAANMRKLTLEKVAKEKILVAGMHIQFPGIGNITKSNDGFVFIPVK
jgi:glyoxylase-like metal-dependent hydrolase (beta-lactamase superfamily II)